MRPVRVAQNRNLTGLTPQAPPGGYDNGVNVGEPKRIRLGVHTVQHATLNITITSPGCARYRLLDSSGRMLWQNRVTNAPAGHAGARERMAAWAVQHGYKVVARQLEKRRA